MRLPLALFALVSVSACAGRYHTESQARRDPLQARLDMALRVRAQLSYYFVQLGAVVRPPMPEAIAETAGPPPFEGAEWTAGAWVWTEGRWEWRPGGWGEPDVFTAAVDPDPYYGGEGDEVDGFYDDGLRNPPIGYGSRLRDHRTHGRNTSGWTSASHPDAIVRDHRTHKTTSGWSSSSHPDATVHDHRESSSSSSSSSSNSSSSNDTKKDDKDTKDYGGVRFGHGR
jgi:hypothetical protein